MQTLKVSLLLITSLNSFHTDSSVSPTLLFLLFLDLRKLASVLVDGWMATIRSQSVSSSGNSPAGTDQSSAVRMCVVVLQCLLPAAVCNTLHLSFRQEKEEGGEQGARARCEGQEWR